MSNETSKSVLRRLHDSRFVSRYFVGSGIDIGCGKDSIGRYSDIFPFMGKVVPWDISDGDAQMMASVPDNSYDFVHSSHCLEHLVDPYEGLRNWFRILKPNGHIIVTIPDEDLYERGVFPSRSNFDHKCTFTIYKKESWSPKSINVMDLIKNLENVEIIKIELLDATFCKAFGDIDQTLGIGECAIEFILRKKEQI